MYILMYMICMHKREVGHECNQIKKICSKFRCINSVICILWCSELYTTTGPDKVVADIILSIFYTQDDRLTSFIDFTV